MADVPVREQAPRGSGWIDPAGYRMVLAKGHPNAQDVKGTIFEHRLVMAEHLGRPLLATETVHHKNGVRHDNSIDNLELRVGAHGAGITTDEAVAWATEILRRYAPQLLRPRSTA